MEPGYWRSRLEVQRATRPFLLITPRPDLSTAGCEIQEIRFQAHDGVRLWGLMGRCPLFRSDQPATLRLVGACQLPTVNVDSVQQGCTEFVVQVPAGRRLEDRVLDALRLAEIAANFKQVDASQVGFDYEQQTEAPDEVLIADKLRLRGIF